MITGVHATDDKRDRDHNDHNQDGDEVRSNESERDSREHCVQAADRSQPHKTSDAEIRLEMFLNTLIPYCLHDQTDSKCKENYHREDFTEEPLIGLRITFTEQIRKKMIVFGIGPAGTGKTYLAMAMAVTAFRNEEVSRIILTRPAIEAGEKLGFLPGDLQSKVDPYLRPLYDALYQIMGADSFAKNMERGLIEVAPLAYMRGRTLDNAFIILDEAQNTTPAQMKMFLTRIGFGSKVVVTGDASQKDLPRDAVSGLDVAAKVLKKIDDIGFCQLTSKDVVRHPLVQQIVQAYEDYEKKQKPSRSTSGTRTVRRKKNDHTD